MIPIRALFESHLTVRDLDRSIAFYGGTLGLKLAHRDVDRKAAFFRIGGPGESMLGLWELGSSPPQMDIHFALCHIAFKVDLPDLIDAPKRLRAADVEPLDFWGNASEEPTVLAWMPAASVYFRDPDGNLLEFLTMLPGDARPGLGVVHWNRWESP